MSRERYAELRQRKGITLQEVSEYTGIPKKAIWKYELGEKSLPRQLVELYREYIEEYEYIN